MNEGLFWSSYSECIALLRKIEMLKMENVHKGIPYSPECNEYSRGNEYKIIYQKMVDNFDYDILLKDDSLLQMSLNNDVLRMLFIQNPLEYITFESYLASSGLDDIPKKIDEYHLLFDDDYNQFLAGMKINGGAVYMRYDVDAKGRNGNERIHSYTHLHIGLKNHIRIPVSKYLTPLCFMLFVIRHVYYDIWVNIVRNSIINYDYKSQCEVLPNELWTEEEKKDIFIV